MEVAAQLVPTLGQLVGEEFRQLRGVGGQVAELRDELATMNAILRMQSEAEDGTVDHFLREWMKQVRELAYDAEDCVDIYIFRIQCRLRDLGFVVWSKRLLSTLFSRRRLAGEIQALRARAVAISERHVRYSVSREALISRSAITPLAGVPVVSATNLGRAHPEFIGDQADVLAHQVMARDHSEDERKLKVFSIVGSGGLGKTRLATEVGRLLEAEFHVQAHVSVSQELDASEDIEEMLKRLLQQIANVKGNYEHSISLAEMDRMSVKDVAWRLSEILKGKRYLIVIDELWSITAWTGILSKLPENNCGSRVIVTTGVDTVVKACSLFKIYIYNIVPLSMDDSKRLFLRQVFGSMDASCPKELKDEMDGILSRCVGLPSSIVSIASFLVDYKSGGKDIWVKVRISLFGPQMERNPTDGMMLALTRCNLLPPYLKVFMMYLCIFPKGYTISKVRLLCRWIAEGLVEEKMGFTLFDVAEQYFDELIRRSMIVLGGDAIITNGKFETIFQVQDMMFQVMLYKSLEANFVSLVGSQYEGMSYHRVRRLSIHDGGQRQCHDSSSKKKTPLRGPTAEGMNLYYVRSLSMFDCEGHKLLDRLGEFTLLRMLDLENCKSVENKHMRAICRMYLLRYLGLKGTDISEMPREVRHLEHLQTLDVSETRLSCLPETVTELRKVERLKFSHKDVEKWTTMWKAPSRVSEMKALREVGNVIVDGVQAAQEIGKLEQVQAIDVYVDGRSEDKEMIRQELAFSLSKMYSLRSLNVGDITDGDHTLDYLIDLPSPPRLLRYLRLLGNIRRLPDWLGLLTNLVEFSISSTKLAQDGLFDILCKAPSLQRIVFDNSFYTGHQLVARTTHDFPALKVMRVPSADEWPKVFEFQEASMRTLEILELNFDGNIEKRIVGIEHLTNLKVVQLMGQEGNPALNHALEEIKAESDRRSEHNKFRYRVVYS